MEAVKTTKEDAIEARSPETIQLTPETVEIQNVDRDRQSEKNGVIDTSTGVDTTAAEPVNESIGKKSEDHAKVSAMSKDEQEKADSREIDLSQGEEEGEISDNDEEIDLEDTKSLDSDGRNKLFERGLSYDNLKKRNCALKCYLGCLTGLQRSSRFSLLPQCLRNIADIYYQKEEYERAVHFIQAEKVFYETALIDTADIQHRLEEAQKQTQNGDSQQDQSLDTVRADEYEHLARMCMDKKQPQLALEYAGKATKIRQQLLGDSHPITVQSLDFFASVYAEVGAEQYKESMKVFNSEPLDDDNQVPSVDIGQSTMEPVSILRKRKSLDKEKRVRFLESQVKNHEQLTKEESIAKSVLWSLLVVCIILLMILGVYLYCHVTGGAQSCTSLRTTIHYAYMRLKYTYYHYTSTNEGSKYT